MAWYIFYCYCAKEAAPELTFLATCGRAFLTPWDWRHRNKQTVTFGAMLVPISAERILPRGSDAVARQRRGKVEGDASDLYAIATQHLYLLAGSVPSSREASDLIALHRGSRRRHGRQGRRGSGRGTWFRG